MARLSGPDSQTFISNFFAPHVHPVFTVFPHAQIPRSNRSNDKGDGKYHVNCMKSL